MEIKELGHVVLFVKNLDRSAHFYRDVLGFAPVPDDPSAPQMPGVMMFSSGRTHHELLLIEVGENAPHPGRGRRSGLYHFGLKIGETDDELRAAIAELRAEGVAVVGTADHTVTHSVYLLDPDGNEIELYVDVPGVDWTDPRAVLAPTRALAL